MQEFSKTEAIERLKNHVESGERVLVSFWTDEDFQMVAEQNIGVRLTDYEVVLAMRRTEGNFDASEGINWDVIETAVESVLTETREETELYRLDV